MEYWHWCTALYVAMCKIYLFFGFRTDSKVAKVVLKCLPVAFLTAMVGLHVLDTRAPVTSTAPGSVAKLAKLFWGLLFSCIGDAYLLFSDYFLFGVIAFAMAQSIYTTLFGGGVVLFLEATQNEVVSGLAVASISVLVYASVMTRMPRKMVIPAAVYALLISMMLWSALVQAQRSLNDLTILGAVGAVLFYTSDVLLTVNKWRMSVPFAPVLIMTTYYSAQLFITGSVLGIN